MLLPVYIQMKKASVSSNIFVLIPFGYLYIISWETETSFISNHSQADDTYPKKIK